MNEWETIDSAPRDGTRILAAEKIWTSRAGHEMGGHVYTAINVTDKDTGTKWLNSSGFCQPTHWMPLPQPPKQD